jgi:uncharacterized DUF497 family protein
MSDLGLIVGFEWDEGNSRKSDEKHGVSCTEAEQVFLNQPLLVLDDVKHSQSEPRFHALGRTTAGRLLHISFTIRGAGTLIRVVSARDMSRQERDRYGQET